MNEAAGLMEEMILAYNTCITKAKLEHVHKMVNTFVPVGVGIASALMEQIR